MSPPPPELEAAPRPPRRPIREPVLLQAVVAAFVFTLMGGLYLWQTRRTAAMTARLEAAESLLDRGDVPSLRRAAAELEAALAIRPGNDVARSRLALAHSLLWLEHGFDDARVAAKALTAAIVRDDLPTPERHVAEALVAVAEKRFSAVDAVAKKVAGPSAAGRLTWALGLAELAREQPRPAREWLRKAVADRPDAAHWQVALGDALDRDGDPRGAAAAWAAAAGANPADLQAVARDLATRLRRGDAPAPIAAELARLDATPAGPRDLAALLGARATLAEVQQDAPAATAAFDEALRLAPDDPWVLGLRRAGPAGAAATRP